MHEDPVVLEGERPLLRHAHERGDAPRNLRLGVRGHERADAVVLDVRRGGVGEVELFELLVHPAAELGRGHLGLEPFRLLVNDPRFRNRPMILETPKEEDGEDMDPVNLATLRRLRLSDS